MRFPGAATRRFTGALVKTKQRRRQPPFVPWIDGVWSDPRVFVEAYDWNQGTLYWTGEDWSRDVHDAKIYANRGEAPRWNFDDQPQRSIVVRPCRTHRDLREADDPAWGGPVP